MTTEMHDPATTPTVPAPRQTWLPWLFAGIAAVVAAVAIGIVIAPDDGKSNGTVAGTQQLAYMRQACTQWHDTYAGSAAPPASWCNDMVSWMSGEMNNGHMMGTMTRGDPDRMLDTCRQRMATGPAVSASARDANAWCDQMVAWMTQNMSDWDDGMMNGSMMNR